MTAHVKAALYALGAGSLFLLFAASYSQEPKTPTPPEVAALAVPFPFPDLAQSSMFEAFPPIPHTVQGMGGPIAVKMILHPTDEEGEELWGSFEAHSRTIEIELEASREFQWHILGHELCHAALFDSGLLNTISDAGQEALCDALGSARIQEMRGR